MQISTKIVLFSMKYHPFFYLFCPNHAKSPFFHGNQRILANFTSFFFKFHPISPFFNENLIFSHLFCSNHAKSPFFSWKLTNFSKFDLFFANLTQSRPYFNENSPFSLTFFVQIMPNHHFFMKINELE